jgi:uncharacterized peroxidase-related enzyme
MTKFSVHTLGSAPAAAKAQLETAKRAYSFVPNLLGTMAESPALLEGYVTLAAIFDKTNLTETERQIILMTNNRLNGCRYCMAAHTSISQGANVASDIIESLRAGTPIANGKYEALRLFAVAVNQTRGWLSEADIASFLAAGYAPQTILEVILGTSLKLMSNYTNHIASTDLDDAFKANAWNAP